MKTTNLLGITDQTMVERVFAEKPGGGAATLAVYDRFSAFGFSRLRQKARFAALSDLEKREAAYDAAGRFLVAILSGQYQPMEGAASEAYYWTICHRRAVDVLRKLVAPKSERRQSELTEPEELIPVMASFVRREPLDEATEAPGLSQPETITSWLDAQLIWEIARKHLGRHCYEILVETLQKDRSPEAYSKEKGYAPGSLKALKTKCLSQLRALVREYF